MTPLDINALARLKRAGAPASKTNAKLRDASATVAGYLCQLAPHGCPALDQLGYAVSGTDLVFLDEDGEPFRVGGDGDLSLIHQFCRDVAAGLVEEVEHECASH